MEYDLWGRDEEERLRRDVGGADSPLLAAAKVIQLTPHINEYLERTDPMALKQLREAISAEQEA